MENRGPAIDSKFRRVLVAAHRAEQLMKGARAKVESSKRKHTRVAMEEVDRSLVEWGYGPPPPPAPEQAAEGAAEQTEQAATPAEVH